MNPCDEWQAQKLSEETKVPQVRMSETLSPGFAPQSPLPRVKGPEASAVATHITESFIFIDCSPVLCPKISHFVFESFRKLASDDDTFAAITPSSSNKRFCARVHPYEANTSPTSAITIRLGIAAFQLPFHVLNPEQRQVQDRIGIEGR
jgi:hypothetical protein